MTQSIILDKFITFLEYEEKKHLRELDDQIQSFPSRAARITQQKNEFLERQKQLKKKLQKGFCFGFSLVHAAMDYLGKLDWWEEALIRIADWDEQAESLNAPVTLSNAVATDNNQSPKFSEIIARAMNYIVSSQANETEYFFHDLKQTNILKPGGYERTKPSSKANSQPESKINRSFFELLDEEEKQEFKVKTIKTEKRMTGQVTKEQLMIDLADNLPEKAIILVHNEDHNIRIARQGTQWMVYDPNYIHKRDTIHTIGSKSECIDEIFEIFKNVKIQTISIGIQIACFEENVLVHFHEHAKRLKALDISLFEDLGFHIMAQFSPDDLLTLVQRLGGLDDSPQKKEFLSVITKALTKQKSDGWTGLQVMAQHSADALLALIDHINDSTEGRALLLAITQGLTKQKSDGWNGLQLMAQYSVDALLALVTHINDSAEGKTLLFAITQALTQQNSDGWTGLMMMAQHSADALFTLVTHVNDSAEGKELLSAIAQALTQQNLYSWTGLTMMAWQSADALLALIKRIDDSTEGKALLLAISQALTKQNSDGWTGLQVMARYSPDALLALVEHVNDSTEGKALLLAIAQALTKQNSDDCSGLQTMSEYSPYSLHYILTGMAEPSSKNYNSEPPLRLLLDMPNGLDLMLKILAAKGLDNKTTCQFVYDKYPPIKAKIIALICQHLSQMKSEELLVYKKEIRRALNDKNAPYRGICKQSSLFRKYTETDLYKEMLKTIDKTLADNRQETMNSEMKI